MFKIIIFTIVLAAIVNGAPINNDSTAETLAYTNEVNPDGSYSYRYDTSNGISAQESGVGGVSAIGGYHYTSPNGEPVIVTYIADDNGYQPQSDLLPQVPPVPEHVIRLLQWLAKNPSEDDGSYKS